MADSDNFIIAENHYQQKIYLDPQDVIGKTILQKGLYDKTGLYFIEKILSRLHNPVVFDIGASIGNHALRMSPYSHQVYLFEPQAKLAEALEKTKSLNHLDKWKIFNYGLSNENKCLTLYRNTESNIETSFVPELKNKNFIAEEATVRIGDQVVDEHALSRLDFIKIDVEGFEAKVIRGLAHSISQFRPLVFMEWDKEITKAEFQTNNLFPEVFKAYLIQAITRNPQELSLYKKTCSLISRLFSKNTVRKRKIIGKFDPQKNYRHLVLIPEEKADLLSDLY